MTDYVVQAYGRVIDGEGRNLGRTVMGDVTSSDGHYAGARVLALGHFDGHEPSANLGHEADGAAAGDAEPLPEDLGWQSTGADGQTTDRNRRGTRDGSIDAPSRDGACRRRTPPSAWLPR